MLSHHRVNEYDIVIKKNALALHAKTLKAYLIHRQMRP